MGTRQNLWGVWGRQPYPAARLGPWYKAIESCHLWVTTGCCCSVVWPSGGRAVTGWHSKSKNKDWRTELQCLHVNMPNHVDFQRTVPVFSSVPGCYFGLVSLILLKINFWSTPEETCTEDGEPRKRSSVWTSDSVYTIPPFSCLLISHIKQQRPIKNIENGEWQQILF